MVLRPENGSMARKMAENHSCSQNVAFHILNFHACILEYYLLIITVIVLFVS